MNDHVRGTGPMLASPRCGAKTRSGDTCRSPTVQKSVAVCTAAHKDQKLSRVLPQTFLEFTSSLR